MSGAAAVTFALDADGVGWVVFDAPHARANILNSMTRAAFADAITRAEGEPALRALIITSGKERIFIAGADLNEIAALADVTVAAKVSRAGQQLFQRLADFPRPVVCAIHGACVGGGLELALACHWRIATDAAVTQIGLPETGIGTIPGWGGCVRLPRLIGARPALDHIFKAKLLSAAAALQAGIVDEVVPEGALRARAREVAWKFAAEGCVRSTSLPVAPMPEFFAKARESVLAKTKGQQPALLVAIDVIEQGLPLDEKRAFEIEARIFGEVTTGAVCKNMIHAFVVREAARKRTLDGWFAPRRGRPSQPDPIRCVGVVGAGVMGSGISQYLAATGLEVVLRDVSEELVQRGMSTVRRLFEQSVQQGRISADEARVALQRVAGTTTWDGFDRCDLVIEAIVEDVEAKRQLFIELALMTRPDAILASNTSALPIEAIAGHVADASRTLGIHFFNPVGRMALVELIVSAQTSSDTAERALMFVRALGKSPVICRSSPGFLVTRVLFFYLNEAVRRWEDGFSTSAIDAAMRDFGWPMGPMRLIDEVGVDVTDFIFGEMEHYFADRFKRSHATTRLLAAGLRGRKNGASRGFYRYDAAGECVNDDETVTARTSQATTTRGRSPDEIVDDLMRVMVREADRCLAEGVVKSANDVDFALLSGAGFPVFRGGLMRWARQSFGEMP